MPRRRRAKRADKPAIGNTYAATSTPQTQSKNYFLALPPEGLDAIIDDMAIRAMVVLLLIQVLVLDEYHPPHNRHLLAMSMPNFWFLLTQHEKGKWARVTEREKR